MRYFLLSKWRTKVISRNTRNLLATLLLSSIVYTVPVRAETWSKSSEPDKPLAFDAVNQQLFKNYTHAKDEIRQKLGPIVMCSNVSVTLLKGKERSTVPFIRPHYTGLKEVAHITLGSFILLTNHTDEELTAEKIEKLKEYRDGIEKASAELQKNEGLEPVDQARQQELVKKTLAFLDKVIAAKRVSTGELDTYVRTTTIPDLENAYEAAGSQITTMDDAMSKWHREMTAEEWKKLHVIILTTHMPRKELLAFQYFQKLLNQPEEGEQIIVAESAGTTTDEQAIDLLLTHILDGKVAVAFFQDPWRMHRDLLSDGAKEWLQKHKLKANELTSN
jgi:hypothetical protein